MKVLLSKSDGGSPERFSLVTEIVSPSAILYKPVGVEISFLLSDTTKKEYKYLRKNMISQEPHTFQLILPEYTCRTFKARIKSFERVVSTTLLISRSDAETLRQIFKEE